MTTALVLAALFALLTWGLNRNHTPGPAGSRDVEDRDAVRVAAELRAREPEPVRPEVSARRAATVRLATGSR
ncbi:hypothetical protein L6E12_32765 [Actinokineospora sp. PR83]|uniref:hypothetical protein n=1 Tax=Actinokineospora sp. PR83 TaxID=2884908 RepID=UPI001F436110|nr:hypothetical protein [Actinokineospora sp. PR83]MCG8920547.1 hypothetical protein [Actinokineospora sp. PR83]